MKAWTEEGANGRNVTVILFLASATATFECAMEFKPYPMDSQTCAFLMTSNNFPADTLQIRGVIVDHFKKDFKGLADFRYALKTISRIHKGGVSAFGYSEFGFEITLERKLSPFIWKYYMPAACCVIMTSMSFLIPPDAIPGRTALLVTLFLVMSGLFNSVQVFNLSHIIKPYMDIDYLPSF